MCYRSYRLLLTVAIGLASFGAAAGQSTSPEPAEAATPLRLVFVHSTSCEKCRQAKVHLAEAMERFGPAIELEMLESFADEASLMRMLAFEAHYDSPKASPPVMFIGRRYLIGLDDIVDNLSQVIAAELAAGSVTFDPGSHAVKTKSATTQAASAPAAKRPAVPEPIRAEFLSYKSGMIALAGLADGINPCAFTTIIFLLSMLSRLGKKRRDLIAVGVGFTLAIFVTYLLLGLAGLIGLEALGDIKAFSVKQGIAMWLTRSLAIAVLGLAAWSVVDFIRYVRSGGDTRKATLGMPKSIRGRINKVIREGLQTRSLLLGSVIIGVLVALLESVCTGQVYGPILVFVLREPDLRQRALAFLLLYNVMFILPLVVVLVLSYMGVRSDKLGNFLRDHLGAFKLVMAGVFAALGVLLLATTF